MPENGRFTVISLQTPAITLHAIRFSIQNSTFRKHIASVFYVLQNQHRLLTYTALLTGFYNRDGLCLLRGTDWVFIYSSG
jgi:hypothetical protein